MMTRIKNQHGTFTWNPKSLRVNQVVKIKDLTGRHGDEIGTARVAITEAETPEGFKKAVENPFGLVKKGQVLNKTTKVVGV